MEDTKERTLLIVDDSAVLRTAVRNAVESAGVFSTILEAQDGMEALKVFFKNKIDFIVTDVMMPRVDGYKFISTVKDSESGKDIPVIIMSASRKEAVDKIKGLNVGASDYVIKPFDAGELLARIRNFLKLKELQDELKDKNVLLEKLAITDELTGLYNRRYFYDHVKMHIALSKRHQYSIGCLMIDIDHFKKVNDTMGHDCGDAVLRGVAKTLSGSMREGEVLARFGGEEFVICLCRADKEGAKSAAERFRKAVEIAAYNCNEDCTVKLTISIGIAVYPYKESASVDDIIKIADEALYCAKEKGRNKSICLIEGDENCKAVK